MRILKLVAALLLMLGLAYGGFYLVLGYTLERIFSHLRGDEQTLLSGIDLTDGDYRLMIYDGSEGGTGPDDRIARLIDDHETIETYRDQVDIEFSLTEYLPGEGRGDYYVFVYRNEDVVAGRSVPSFGQIIAPRALLEAGQAMRYRVLSLPLEDFRRVLAEIGERPDAIIRDFTTPSTTDPSYQHSFRLFFPTIAVSEDSGFDPDDYARGLADRIRNDIGDVPFRLSDAGTRPQTTMILDESERAILDEEGMALTLSGLELHEPYLIIDGSPETYSAAASLDLASYVADERRLDLITNAWMSATGAQSPPAEIMLDDYVAEGAVGRLSERQYSIRYWEPLDSSRK